MFLVSTGQYKLIFKAYIRCLCVMAMRCTRKTETSLYDWSAIVVGMSNGYVRFFTEKGLLLRSDHVSDR